jgi:hypothetical protein
MQTNIGIAPPKKGEVYRCEKCGMEMKVTADCHCQEPNHVHLECCGQELTKQ